ncbi:MAG TPA: tRNA (adenosine(37)-N6)-threonylcarbamoyltransferase complex ATPase subunit type 1 TsaE [Candidatus Paceibacterota bacterium]|nr:tRNA (adenosine(37)-N6)-threonylcarbamoyltransferase complex ATPase subunit type 1 TsaE [Candidatus Paceibacterota bacterium]
MTTYQSSSSAATKKLGRELAKKILESGQSKKAAVVDTVGKRSISLSLRAPIGARQSHTNSTVIVALGGKLGAGKTTFTQGFAAGLGIRSKIISPTFILIRKTELPRLGNSQFRNFIHIDAYRADAKDFLKLGFKELAEDNRNIILVEWADRLKKILPKSATWLKLSHGKKENERTIKIK